MRSGMGLVGLVLGSVCLFSGNRAVADDFYKPSYRGHELSVHAVWDFDTEPADLRYVTGKVDKVGREGVQYHFWNFRSIDFKMNKYNEWEWKDGKMHSLSAGFFRICLSNWVDNEPKKDLRIQITYSPDDANHSLYVSDLTGSEDNPSSGDGYYIGKKVQTGKKGDGKYYEDWRIFPNPDQEHITVFVCSDMYIDQVIVDTVSWSVVPEPGTVSLLAMAGLSGLGVAELKRRRNKKRVLSD